MYLKELQNLRRHYALETLDEKQAPSNPFELFKNWMEEAIKAELPEPNAFNLSTVDAAGKPHARIVLLKGLESNKFIFYTNYKSAKGRQMTVNNHVAATFLWLELERQVRIEGTVNPISREESEAYFQSRPRESRLGAWASAQSSVVSSRQALEKNFARVTNEFEGKEIPLPDFWGGYAIDAHYIEFWQGRASRMHDRIAYTREAEKWLIQRLSP